MLRDCALEYSSALAGMLNRNHRNCAGTAAGIAAGIPVVGVLTSQSVKRMHEAGVFVAVNDYHELTDLVKKHVPFDENCDVKL